MTETAQGTKLPVAFDEEAASARKRQITRPIAPTGGPTRSSPSCSRS